MAALAAFVMAASLVTPARAADDEVPAVGSLADTTKPAVRLKETVVTGSRYARELYRSPQALSLLSRYQIRQRLAQVPGDALALLPGVSSSKDSPWAQQPVLRGLAGQRVLVLVDGSPMNNVRGRGPQPSLVGSEQVERIEVVRGPASVAYGSDALGGVVNIITREAGRHIGPNSLHGAASIGGSTADSQRHGYLELVPQIGSFSAFVSGGGRKAEDFESPAGKIPDSGFESYNGLVNARYDFTDKTSLKGGYQLYRSQDIGIPGLTVDTPEYAQEFRFKEYDRDFAHVTLDHGYANSWLAGTRVRGYWQREKRNFQSDIRIDMGPPPFPGPWPDNLLLDKDRFFDLQTWGFQVQATTVRNENYMLTGGVDLARDKPEGTNVELSTFVDASGNTTPGPFGAPATSTTMTMSIPEGDFDSYAGYLQSELFINEQWTANAGGRFTYYRYNSKEGVADPGTPGPGGSPPSYFPAVDVNNGALSGSLGLVFNPMADLYFTANVANGYRQPNAQDLFFNGPASVGFVLGNTELEPERSVSYDMGVRWGPGDFAFTGNLFFSTYKDLIDALPVNAVTPAQTDSFQYFNIAKAQIWGGEAEAEWRFHRQARARAAVSGAIGDITSSEAILGLYGVVADKAPLPSVPPFGGSLSIRVTDPSQRYWVEPSTRFSWRYNRLPLAPPGLEEFIRPKKEWIVADLYAGAVFPTGQRVIVGVRNIGDALYEPALSSLVEPGISFVGSVSTDF